MNANLMRAAGKDLTTHQCRNVTKSLDALPRGPRWLATFAHRHAMAVRWMTRNGAIDRPTQQLRHARHDREVLLLQRPGRKLIRERAMRLVRLRHHDHSGGLLVEPVNNARPLD